MIEQERLIHKHDNKLFFSYKKYRNSNSKLIKMRVSVYIYLNSRDSYSYISSLFLIHM